jgi:hypothetical protein
MIDDIMFDNLFVDQHRFEYYEPSDNEDDVDDDDDVDGDDVDGKDVDDEIIHHVSEFGDASRSSFVVSRDWALVIDIFQEGLI